MCSHLWLHPYDADTILVSATKLLASVLLGVLVLLLLSPFLISLVMFWMNSAHGHGEGVAS